MKTKIELISEQIHEMWMRWAKNILKEETNISEERKQRWIKDCFKPYEALSEEMKQLDRDFAIKMISIIENKNEH
ncbi:RyR domain-containing protein [Olleya sp. R77988]|uniref:RyR domain-containing protein n=1 Tax=Olleya sp. R77988 TaxID=3093875 RepID=UPI0037C74606